MGCSCGKGRPKRETYKVRLQGGLEVTKSSEAAAKAFAARHPGSTIIKQAP